MNKVYTLIFKMGISTGYEKLIGLYTTREKAENAQDKHMKKYAHQKHHYSIKEIEIDKELNYTLAEW